MAVLDWLQQLLGGGDPEAAGAAQASTAMQPMTQPMTQPWLDKVLSGEMARGGIQDVNRAFATGDTEALLGAFGPAPLATRVGRAAEAFAGPKFPQYAESYPPLGEPVTKIGDRGNEYLSKGWSPEMTAFAKERTRIAKDMEKTGYEPYFDPAQRSNVDPSYYPPNLDTATVIPAKQATIDTHMASVGSEDARARLQAGYQRGSEMPNTEQWYAMKQLEDEFIKHLGPEEGRKAFQDKFATSMAATTGGMDPESNFLMAMYGNYLRKQGLPYPQGAYEMPYPIGGQYAMGNIEQHQKIFDAGGFPSLGASNPKRHDFSQAFTGNPNVATMDEQMTSGMTPGQSIPKYYGLNAQVAREEAAKAGVSPRDFQDVTWAGFKNLKDPKYASGLPMIENVNASIERTHRLTGMPKEEIVRRGIISGEIPLYAVLGAAGLGGLGGLGGTGSGQ